MNGTVDLKPVDKVEVTTLYENLVDSNALGQDTVRRLSAKGGNNIVSKLLADERRVPFVGGHGLSMLVRVTRDGITRTVLFDAGGSPDGLMHNLDCLELSPRDWNCVVLSHGTGTMSWDSWALRSDWENSPCRLRSTRTLTSDAESRTQRVRSTQAAETCRGRVSGTRASS